MVFSIWYLVTGQSNEKNKSLQFCSTDFNVFNAVGFLQLCSFCFVHPIFCFLFLVTFGKKVTKIQKYYLIFFCILQGKMGKTEKTGKTKVTKIPKIKRRNYGMNKTFDKQWLFYVVLSAVTCLVFTLFNQSTSFNFSFT